MSKNQLINMPVLLIRAAWFPILKATCATLRSHGTEVTFTSLVNITGICQGENRVAQYLKIKISEGKESSFVPHAVEIEVFFPFPAK